MSRPAMYCDAYVRAALAAAATVIANPDDETARRAFVGFAGCHGIDCAALIGQPAPTLRAVA